LQADLQATIEWAQKNSVPFAFSDRNAGGFLANFYSDPVDLDKVNWPAVARSDFREPEVKEGKQAEFLMWDEFPWDLVEEIGVRNAAMMTPVQSAINSAKHRPTVSVKNAWYY
jgi:hypothetical protein